MIGASSGEKQTHHNTREPGRRQPRPNKIVARKRAEKTRRQAHKLIHTQFNTCMHTCARTNEETTKQTQNTHTHAVSHARPTVERTKTDSHAYTKQNRNTGTQQNNYNGCNSHSRIKLVHACVHVRTRTHMCNQLNQLTIQTVNQPKNKQTSQPIHQSTSQPATRPNKQASNKQASNQAVQQAIKQTNNPANKQSFIEWHILCERILEPRHALQPPNAFSFANRCCDVDLDFMMAGDAF